MYEVGPDIASDSRTYSTKQPISQIHHSHEDELNTRAAGSEQNQEI